MRFFMLINVIWLGVTFAGAGAEAKNEQYNMKYRNLDRNRDGIISRSEWRGKNRSFENQDWNGDGILSGYEVVPGGKRSDYYSEYYNGYRDNGNYFSGLDSNRDGVVSKNEWKGDLRVFERRDCNRDLILTQDEILSQVECGNLLNSGNFQKFDSNKDGYLSRTEWRDGAWGFTNKDCDRDDRLSRVEYFTQNCSSNTCDFDCVFRDLDANSDGRVSRSEWPGNSGAFDRLDRNNNGSLTRSELSYAYQDRQSGKEQILWNVSDIITSIFGR